MVVSERICGGLPVDSIVDRAHDLSYDLIMMGTYGLLTRSAAEVVFHRSVPTTGEPSHALNVEADDSVFGRKIGHVLKSMCKSGVRLVAIIDIRRVGIIFDDRLVQRNGEIIPAISCRRFGGF